MGDSPSGGGGGGSEVEDAGERGIAGVAQTSVPLEGVAGDRARLRASAAGATVPGRGGGGKGRTRFASRGLGRLSLLCTTDDPREGSRLDGSTPEPTRNRTDKIA
jgi:hypothetical protein